MNQEQFDKLVKRVKDYIQQRANIPAAKCGKAEITHEIIPVNKEVMLVSIRNSLFQGLPAANLTFNSPLTIRHLSHEDHGTWMTDSPQELWQMDEAIRATKGKKVLVGGLGLGCIAHLMSQKAKEVTVVEIDEDIIKLVQPYINPKIQVIKGDIYKFAKKINRDDYQVAFIDTWQGTGEMVWLFEAVPLLRLIRPKVKKVFAWNLGEMAGQIIQGSFKIVDMDAKTLESSTLGQYWVFRKAMERYRPVPRISLDQPHQKQWEVESENQNDSYIILMSQLYAHHPGSKIWEHHFGCFWDEMESRRKKKRQEAT